MGVFDNQLYRLSCFLWPFLNSTTPAAGLRILADASDSLADSSGAASSCAGVGSSGVFSSCFGRFSEGSESETFRSGLSTESSGSIRRKQIS